VNTRETGKNIALLSRARAMFMCAGVSTILTNGAHIAKLIVGKDVHHSVFIRDIGGSGAIMIS
jgi:hypothetical protein